MYDEQIKLRQIAPNADWLKSVSPAPFPHARVVSSLTNRCWLELILRSEKSLVSLAKQST